MGPSIETRTGSKKTQMPLITTDLTHREGHRKNHDTLPMFFEKMMKIMGDVSCFFSMSVTMSQIGGY